MNPIPISDQPNCCLSSCLFFATTKLARELGRLAEEAFQQTGLSPSHALLLYIVNLKSAVAQKEIGTLLHLTPSTVTRLVEKLERKGYVKKQSAGKNVCLRSTAEGLAQQNQIIDSWDNLHRGYQNILSESESLSFLGLSGKLLENLADKPK